MEELNHFRNEISEMVELERGLLRETLERESASIRRQVLDAYANNKSEILSMLKVEIQKRLQNARDKVHVMTDALKRDMDNLKEDLGQAQVSTLEFCYNDSHKYNGCWWISNILHISECMCLEVFTGSQEKSSWIVVVLACLNSIVHAGYSTLHFINK